MTATFDKKVPRPLGLSAWSARSVQLTSTHLEVFNPQRRLEYRAYALSEYALAEPSFANTAQKGRFVFALVHLKTGEAGVTLAGERFEVSRWVTAMTAAIANARNSKVRRRTAVFAEKPSPRRRYGKRGPSSPIVEDDAVSSSEEDSFDMSSSEGGRMTSLTTSSATEQAPYKRFELVYESGPLGMALDHDAPFRLVISEVRESAHSHSLRVGDEIVGLGSLSAPMTTFFEDDAKIELGDEGLFPARETYDLLTEAVEKCDFPLRILLRRRVVSAREQTSEAAPKPEGPPAELEQYLKMAKMGLPAGAVLQKAIKNSLGSSLYSMLERLLEGKPSPPKEPEIDEALEKYLKMTKMGLPAGAVLQKARKDGISAQQLEQLERIMQQRSGTGAPTAAPKKAVDGKDDQLETYVKHKARGVPPEAIALLAEKDLDFSKEQLKALHARLGLEWEEPPDTALSTPHHSKKGPGTPPATRRLHWDAVTDRTAREKRGSVFQRSSRKNRESLGGRAESMFEENADAKLALVAFFGNSQKARVPVPKRPASDPMPAAAGAASPGSAVKSGKSLKSLEKELLGHQPAQNLEIALRPALKLPLWPAKPRDERRAERALVRALVARGAPDEHDANVISSLLRALPTDEEIATLVAKANEQPAHQPFCRPTRFVLAADAWRGRLRPTLRGALLCASGEADCALAVASARKVSAACVRLRECPQLRASLHTVLAIGNALNKGRATAYAYSVVELERLACTKTNDNQTGYDFLAHVLEHDKQKRGEDGLDGAAIDAELRSVLSLLSDCADDVPRERTFEVQERLFTETKELVALLKASGAIGEASGTFDPEDDAACDAAAADVFVATAVAQLEEIDAARATLDAALLDLSTELTGLRERFDEPVLPIDDIFKALRNFASMLITARAKLLKKSAPSRS